jgi:hypothetical protein
MKKVLLPIATYTALVMLACAFAGVAKATTCSPSDCTSAGGVTYTFTNTTDGDDTGLMPPGNGIFDVTLVVDTTGATASGTLSKFAVNLAGASSVTMESVSSNAAGWTVLGMGNVNQCGTGASTFWCSSGPAITVTSGGPGDVFTFVFEVNMGSSALPETHIQAFQGQGGLAISNDIGIGTPGTSVPEPSSIVMLGAGLLGLALLGGRRVLTV